MLHKIDVVCYSGYRVDERPLKFTFKNKKFQIKKILNRSIEEPIAEQERLYRFQVKCTDNKTYSLLYNSDLDEWFLEDK
jgi:hypothetical protein